MSERAHQAPAITIRAEPSQLDSALCKFTISQPVHPGGPFFFDSAQRASGSPLIERLFQIPGIASVLVSDNIVTVGKNSETSWLQLMKPVGGAIREQLLSGVPTILERKASEVSGGRSDPEIRKVVEELLEREVNPSVASHGGKISVVDVKDATLYIAMSGGCQGCAASQVTLKQGVEVMVRRVVPEVRAIIDATDHAAGTQPYYDRD
ncbi:MAG TPA: NifU family protein [Myxococcaceae bacterium]|nr:NifU family protein [Myxococcaceae bacterium]